MIVEAVLFNLADLPPAERTAFALEMLEDRAAHCEPIALRAWLDGADISGNYVLLEALNIPYVGPNLFLAPDSQPGDGTLEVVLVREEERERLRNNLASWQSNRERLSVLPTHRGRSLRIEWSGFKLHIDDELWPDGASPPASGTIELALTGQAVEFLAPDSKQR